VFIAPISYVATAAILLLQIAESKKCLIGIKYSAIISVVTSIEINQLVRKFGQ